MLILHLRYIPSPLTGTALPDVAAEIVYEKAVASGIGSKLIFFEQQSTRHSGDLKKMKRISKRCDGGFLLNKIV